MGVEPEREDEVDFAERMGELHRELEELRVEGEGLMVEIERNFEELGL